MEKTETNKTYTFQTAPDDPYGVRVYTLQNGLTVYLAKNDDAPKIQTYIAVRAGSNDDPVDNTGLAHYLEHMMFKGTSKIGSADWAKEEPLLNEISELYEQHKAAETAEEKKEIYRRIDAVSGQVSQYAIANEYDKIISEIGASGTNAHTWLDETIYKNSIPSGELEKWLKLEYERFSDLTLRLFHTELETVYEEFNRGQDNDGRLVNYTLMELLFPKHPNGQQTTIGKAEHLKNPSMAAIHQYFDTYYVPNNMAVILVGDLDFDATIALVDQYFGRMIPHELPPRNRPEEEQMTSIQRRIVYSPSVPRLHLAWRTDSAGTREAHLAELSAQILSNNGQAGLIDININQRQTALRAGAFFMPFKEYGNFTMVIIPHPGQGLQEAEQLLLQQIELLKEGAFEEWMLPAIVNDMKLARLTGWETADGLATSLYESFIHEQSWADELAELDQLAEITKREIVDFAREFFRDNYAVVYKETGENTDLIRIENPGITPVDLNRDAQSAFAKEIAAMPSIDPTPQFVDYDAMIEVSEVAEKKFSFVRNKYNEVAQVNYIFPFGSDHDRKLPLAIEMLEFLGSEQLSQEDLRLEFFKLGISHSFRTSADRLSLMISGLEENIAEGLQLIHRWLLALKPDNEIYQMTVQTILGTREAVKRDKNRIQQALTDYAKFGRGARSRDVLSIDELRQTTAQELTDKIRNLLFMPYEIFYYGQNPEQLRNVLPSITQPATRFVPAAKQYPEPKTGGKVYIVDYDMVQAEFSQVARGGFVDVSRFGEQNVFNEYFGRGLSSVVFQEIRERRSLVYAAGVTYTAAEQNDRHDYIRAFIGTQPDKLQIAVEAMDELLNHFPQYELQFQAARRSALKRIASGRITRQHIYFNYINLKKLGVSHDIRRDMYEQISALDLERLTAFYNRYVKNVGYNTAILGRKDLIDFELLSSLGKVEELTLEELFGF